MKPTLWIAPLAVALLAWPGRTQDAPVDRTTVAFSDPSRPGTVKVSLLNGGITVKGYEGREVIVEARVTGRRSAHSQASPKADGLRRLDDPSTGLSIEEQDNVMTIGSRALGNSVQIALQVPPNTSLNLKCVNDGDIRVENVRGEIDADNLNGAVILQNISGAAVAHALNKDLTVVFDHVTAGKSMSFSSMNGDIDVTLPADAKARVKMKTGNGEIYTDFDVRLEPSARNPQPQEGRREGRYRLQFDKALDGTINGGGAEMQFTTFNGKIYIRKKK